MNMSSLESPFKFEILAKSIESYHINRGDRLLLENNKYINDE